MKFKLLVLFSICLVFYQCKNKSQTVFSDNTKSNSTKYVLNIGNDSCKIKIKEVDRSKRSNFSNSYTREPRFEIRANCISLRQLIGIIKNVDTSLIISNSKDLDNQFYSVFINQKTTTDNQDSSIKNDIMKAFDLKIQKKYFSIDTTIISMNDQTKYKRFSNNEISDTVYSKYRISKDSIEFENSDLDNIVVHLKEIYNKVLILNTSVAQRIDYKIKRDDWESVKDKLESDLGIHFKTHVTQIEKYLITDQSYVLK